MISFPGGVPHYSAEDHVFAGKTFKFGFVNGVRRLFNLSNLFQGSSFVLHARGASVLFKDYKRLVGELSFISINYNNREIAVRFPCG